MHNSYIPIMHCKKMVVTDMLFHQCAVIEFLMKEVNSAGVICKQLCGVYGDACMVPAVSEGG
jgi:hypothetical protein